MITPLYKKLKNKGTSVYVFPSSSEDISSSYQNTNYKMYFSKYVLLNLPKQNLNPTDGQIKFDFDNAFKKSNNATPTAGFSDSVIESLRNYVANQEVVIRESRLNDRKYYYNVNSLETPAEKIFWKWCSKLGILDLEPAIPGEEYFSNLDEFQPLDITDDNYFNEILWKERSIIDYRVEFFRQSGEPEYTFPPKLEIEINKITNFKVGDTVNLYNVSNLAIYGQSELAGSQTQEGITAKVLKVISEVDKQRIVLDLSSTLPNTFDQSAQIRLVYHQVVMYIGEVNGVSNVTEANRSYTEVYAHIPDHTGKTPDILFRTISDVNYRPNLTFPIIPSQYQPEIMGAEFFNSPIVSFPEDYPGSYYGQFDAIDYTYRTSNGDSLRRSGDYYGVKGDRNNPVIDNSKIDGLSIDFNTSHYVKMNIPNNTLTNFDQFNALEVDNQPPRDFEFNAILWYYTVEDNNGNTKENLYGISFLNSPDNNPVEEEVSLRFPTIKKLVSNGMQDGTSYAFNLNLNFNIINDNRNEPYNPQAINSLFSMNLFNDAMSKLASTNDSFLNIISEHQFLREEITNIKSLFYTQTDINVINAKIKNLEELLKLYSTNQISSSDSIKVEILSTTPAAFSLKSIDPIYERVENIKTSELYNGDSIIPINVQIPENKSILINIENDDQVEIDFDTNLSVILETELNLNQTIDFVIKGNELSTQNKKLDIFINESINNTLSSILLIGDINLPVFYNKNLQRVNSSYIWSDFKFNIDINSNIKLIDSTTLEFILKEPSNIITNSIKIGDVFMIEDLLLNKNNSVSNFSGQYTIINVDGNKIHFDISSNTKFVSDYVNSTFPYIIHNTTSSELHSIPYISLNKGKTIRLTKVSNSDDIKQRYNIIIDSFKF
jgi:hypothetical protein